MRTLALTLLLVVLLNTGSMAEEPTLLPGVKLEAAGQVIDEPIGHLVPCVADWNADGKKDLIVGQFKGGGIKLYLNEGTNAKPVLKAGIVMEAGAKPIKLASG